MPVFTVPVAQQSQAASGGSYFYPMVMQIKQFSVIGDQMQRDAITPTSAIQLYATVTGTGTPTLVMTVQKQMDLGTTTVANDTGATRTTALSFNRVSFDESDKRTALSFNIYFSLSSAANIKAFIGLHDASSNLSALPTTVRNLGIYIDTSVSNNLYITSANGTSQVTTDTSFTPVLNTIYRLNISWTADDGATINLYSGTYPTFGTLQKSVTVTSFLNGAVNRAPEIAFYVQTLVTVAKTLSIHGWNVSAT